MFDALRQHIARTIAGKRYEVLPAGSADTLYVFELTLERITEHDPCRPGLHYDSIQQLLESATGCASDALNIARSYHPRVMAELIGKDA